jgi:hypothetical protein
MVKKGCIVICKDDDSQDEDFGMSGIVLEGRRDLQIGKEYIVERVDKTHVPSQETLKKHWSAKERPKIIDAWTMLWLKGIAKPVWMKDFRLKKTRIKKS